MDQSGDPRARGAVPLRIALVVLAALVLAACGGGGDKSGKKQKQAAKRPSVPVDVTTVKPRKVDIYAKFPGRVQGKRTVQVLARVEGILQKRDYEEGQIVHKGDPLYTIDPRPFQATVDQRKAAVASAKADLHQAQRTWERVRPLYKANAVSKAERDQARSSLETARAQVKLAKANLESAQIDLGYTSVDAPLTGVTSLRETDEGALVTNGTKLTTITQLDPVYVLFALPEEDAFARRKALASMANPNTDAATRRATIILPGGKRYPEKAKVDFTQSTIDPDTGTVQLRAVAKNPDNALMPGLYVRARVRLATRDNAIVVPDDAISSGQQQAQVFLVKNGKAKPETVDLGPNVTGGRLINKGLTAGDRVITSGLGQLKPGAPVKIKSGKPSKPAPNKGSPDKTARTGANQPAHALADTRIDTSLHLLGAPAPARVAAANDDRKR